MRLLYFAAVLHLRFHRILLLFVWSFPVKRRPMTCEQCGQRQNAHRLARARFLFSPPARGVRGTGAPADLVLLCSHCGADILTPKQRNQLDDGTLIDFPPTLSVLPSGDPQ